MISVSGLIFVGGGFLTLIGINVFERARGRALGKPLRRLILTEADLPHVLVQIPVFNEPETVAGALDCATALDWPRDRLHIQLLDDSSDETSAIAARVIGDLHARGFDILHLRRGDRSGYKAGALAAGLLHSNAPYVAVLDVDFRPPSNWLRKVMPALIADPKASFIQSRCEFANAGANWLTRAQGLMLDAHYVLEQATRFRAGWLFQFNGTAGVWRRAAIAAAGGWSSNSLCEDLDLTVRAEIAGWHGLFSMEPAGAGPRARSGPPLARAAAALVERLRAGRPQAAWPDLGLRLVEAAQILGEPPHSRAGLLPLRRHRHRGAPHQRHPAGGRFRPPICRSSISIAVLVALVAIGMTLTPYVILRRGSFSRYVATVASLTPLMIFVSLSNAPSILKTVFGAGDDWTRTPKAVAVSPIAAPTEPIARF